MLPPFWYASTLLPPRFHPASTPPPPCFQLASTLCLPCLYIVSVNANHVPVHLAHKHSPYKAGFIILPSIRQPELLWFKTAQCSLTACGTSLSFSMTSSAFATCPVLVRVSLAYYIVPTKTLIIPSLTPTYTTTHVPTCPSPATKTSLRQMLLAS